LVDEGFPQGARLKRSVEFQRIQKTGRRFHTKLFVVCYCKKSLSTARFGLTVSRKVGNAVTRNRVKRWLRESIRKSSHQFDGLDVVFIAKPLSANAGQDWVSQEVRRSLQRIQGMKE
jgi:ribonuclease P protein component